MSHIATGWNSLIAITEQNSRKMNQNRLLFFNQTFRTPLILRVKSTSINSYQFMVTQVLKVLLSMSEIRVNIFQDGTVFFPSVVCEKNDSIFPLHSDLLMAFTCFPTACLRPLDLSGSHHTLVCSCLPWMLRARQG